MTFFVAPSAIAARPFGSRLLSLWFLATLSLIGCGHRADASSQDAAWLGPIHPLLDVRTRYENVDDASKSNDANAWTLRARIGLETVKWKGFSALAEMDQIWSLAGQYNSTRNGKTSLPTVADPAMTTLNRLQLSYDTGFDTTIVLGRQRILLADQRYIGNAGWRQHEQTFDAVALTNSSIPGLKATYSYVDRVNRVYGPSSPIPATGPASAYHCDCHLLDLAYSGLPRFTFEAFGYLLALDQRQGPPATKLATTKLSTATFGVRGDYRLKLSDDLSASLLGSYAHQSNYRNNPLSLDLNYWRGEGSVTYMTLAATIGYESMEGNGVAGFSTPLATVHAFDGWADMFLSTPKNGLDNLYLKVAYGIPAIAKILDLDSATATIIHRDFSAEKTQIGIGSEWDAAMEFSYDKASLLLQVANYQGSGIGSGGFADKSVAWVQLSYKY